MFVLDKDRVRAILISELGYSAAAADIYLSGYPLLDDRLEPLVAQWLSSRTVLEFEVTGVSIRHLMQTRGEDFLTAVRMLNRLLDRDLDPVEREDLVNSWRRPEIRW